METKFSKGEWWACCLKKADINPHFIFTGEKAAIFEILCNDKTMPNYDPIEGEVTIEEARANAKLGIAAPLMFYHFVLLANENGWQFAFDIIKKVTGVSYKYGSKSFNNLVEEAKSYFRDKDLSSQDD